MSVLLTAQSTYQTPSNSQNSHFLLVVGLCTLLLLLSTEPNEHPNDAATSLMDPSLDWAPSFLPSSCLLLLSSVSLCMPFLFLSFIIFSPFKRALDPAASFHKSPVHFTLLSFFPRQMFIPPIAPPLTRLARHALLPYLTRLSNLVLLANLACFAPRACLARFACLAQIPYFARLSR